MTAHDGRAVGVHRGAFEVECAGEFVRCGDEACGGESIRQRGGVGSASRRWHVDPTRGDIAHGTAVDRVEQMMQLTACLLTPMASAGGARAERPVNDACDADRLGSGVSGILQGDGDGVAGVVS